MEVHQALHHQVEVVHQEAVTVQLVLAKDKQWELVITLLQMLEETEWLQYNQLIIALLWLLVMEMAWLLLITRVHHLLLREVLKLHQVEMAMLILQAMEMLKLAVD